MKRETNELRLHLSNLRYSFGRKANETFKSI